MAYKMQQFNKPSNEEILDYLNALEDVREDAFEDTFNNTLENISEENEEQTYNDEESYDDSVIFEIMERLLEDVERQLCFKKHFDCRKKLHNQGLLFHLVDYLPNFEIDDEMFNKMIFRETLIISASRRNSVGEEKETIPEGGLCLDIQGAAARISNAKYEEELKTEIAGQRRKIQQAFIDCNDLLSGNTKPDIEAEIEEYDEYLNSEHRQVKNKFLVHLSSEFNHNGYNGGSRITSWVDKDLHTLEERRIEYYNAEVLHEQMLYMALKNQHYYVCYSSKPNDTKVYMSYNFKKTLKYMGEGASFLLMRYLAITQYKGVIELSTTYINGDMCRNIYECAGKNVGIVNGAELEVVKIYRRIIEHCGTEHNICTLLTLNGEIVKQDWYECDYILHLNPLQTLTDKKPIGGPHIELKKTWKEDMELLSKYLDVKTATNLGIKSYLRDFPEIKHMISDYIQLILTMKPEFILEFTQSYFASYNPTPIARVESFERDNKDYIKDLDY